MEKILIKKMGILFILAAIIILLGLYFYFFRINQEAKPFYKDGNFELLNPPSCSWLEVDSTLSSDPFFDKIREDLKIKTERHSQDVSSGCSLRINTAKTDGDFIKKVALYKEKILSNTKNKLLLEEGINFGSSSVFLKFLFEGSEIQSFSKKAASLSEIRIYLVNDRMYFVIASGQSETFKEQCELFAKDIPNLIKISNAQ